MHKSNFRSFANYDYWLSLSWCSGSWKRSQCMMWKCVQSTGPFSFNTHWDRKWKLNNSFCPYYIQHPFKQEWAGKSFFLNFCFHICIYHISYLIYLTFSGLACLTSRESSTSMLKQQVIAFTYFLLSCGSSMLIDFVQACQHVKDPWFKWKQNSLPSV